MPWLGAVAPGIDPGLWGFGQRPTSSGLGQHRRERVTAVHIALRAARRMRAKALRPRMERRVLGRVLAEQTPGHLAQAPLTLGVRHRQALDHRQRVRLPRQNVARQHAAPVPAGLAPRQRHGQITLDRLGHAMVVPLQQDDRAQHARLAQHQDTPGRTGTSHPPATSSALPRAACRTYRVSR